MNKISALATIALSVTLAGMAKPTLVFNEDDSHFFGNPAHASEAALNEYVDRVTAGGHVTHFFMCPNAMRANFDSKVFEPAWAPCDVPGWKQNGWSRTLKELHDKGIDPYSVWSKRCREKGVSPWISMRMNDVHFVNDPKYGGHSKFWREHPQFWREPNTKSDAWGKRALDFAHAEVRKYALAFVEELLARYDVDGLECDWMRFPDHLTPGRERELSPCLDGFMREVRRLANQAAARRRHPVRVAARVDSDPDAALARGTDAFAWAREGSVDWVIPCNFFSSVDFELPFAEWKNRMAAANPAVRVVPGLDAGVVIKGEKKRRMLTVPEYRGWAHRVYGQGAEGVYLFNLFTHGDASEVMTTILREGLAPETVAADEKSIPTNAVRECLGVLRTKSRPLVGAIRWDAYQGSGDYNAVVEKTLSDPDQRWRAPWFATLRGDGRMRIDGSRPGVIEREIDYAADAGLDYWAFVMYNPRPDVGLSRGIELYLKAANRSRMRFAIIAHCHSALTDADWPRERDRWLDYLREPGYVKVLGPRPLVFILRMDDAKQADFRAKAAARGLDPYFVQISSDWIDGRSKWTVPGGDACGRYAAVRNVGGTYADLVADAERLWRLPVERGLEVVPLVTTGWEKTGRKRYPPFWELTQFYHRQKEFPAWPTADEIGGHLKKAMCFVADHPKNCLANTVLVYAWNEHDEGGWLCPTWTPSGKPDTSRLDAIRKVCVK